MRGIELMLGFFPCANFLFDPSFAFYFFLSLWLPFAFIFLLGTLTSREKLFWPRLEDGDDRVSIPMTNDHQPKEWIWNRAKDGKW